MYIPKFSLSLLTSFLVVAVPSISQSTTFTLTGHITPTDVFKFVYAPFTVPPGCTSIYVLQSYSEKGNNSLDLGLFDERGFQIADAINGTTGFRGWSGGFRDNFTVTPSFATPGYNPGPITPGTWNVVLGPYASTPRGIDWTLDITLGFDEITEHFSPAYADTNLDPFPTDVLSDELRWLRGDFHMHSVYSDGRYTPDQQISHALSQELDFIFFTEHNTNTCNEIIGIYQPRDLLVGRGIEVTTRHGHWQALGLDRGQQIDWRYHPGDDPGYEAAVHQVRRAGGLVSINHPFQTCSRCDWTFGDWDSNDAMEVWNGIWDPTDEKAVQKWHELLASGKRVAAIGGSDAHSSPDLVGRPTTVVRSRGSSQGAVIEAAKMGRASIVEGKGMMVELSVSGTGAGDTVVGMGGGGGVMAMLRTKGLEGNMACFVSESGYFHNETVDAADIMVPVEGTRFVRVEVRNETDGMVGLTNPVFFE